MWLKAGGRGTGFEAGLYALLHAVAPGRVLEPIALDVARGWVLLPDGGTALGDRLAGPELSRRSRPCSRPTASSSATSRRTRSGCSRSASATCARRSCRGGSTRRSRWCAPTSAPPTARGTSAWPRWPQVDAWCAALVAAPGAPSLDHNDLHPWNVLDGPRFYDWGDTVVAHPFASMLLGLGFVQRRVLGVAEDAAEILRLRDAYLEPFGDLARRTPSWWRRSSSPAASARSPARSPGAARWRPGRPRSGARAACGPAGPPGRLVPERDHAPAAQLRDDFGAVDAWVHVRMFGPLELRVGGERLTPQAFGGVKPKQPARDPPARARGGRSARSGSPTCCGASGSRSAWRRRSRPTSRCCAATSAGG